MNKTDTYFAMEGKEMVFVKGPFEIKDPLETTQTISKIKSLFGLPTINSRIMRLVPDLLETPLGIRKRIEKKKGKFYFMVFDSILSARGPLSHIPYVDIPFKLKQSKIWPETKVVDWDKLEGKVGNLNKDTIDEVLEDYIKCVVFRYLFGIPDLADRNFMISDRVLYSVDEEAIGRDIDLFDNLKKNRCKKITDFLKENTSLVETLKGWKSTIESDELKALIPKKDMQARVKRLYKAMIADVSAIFMKK